MYFRGTCVNIDATCANIPAVGSTSSDKKSYCEKIFKSGTCTYAIGANCVK